VVGYRYLAAGAGNTMPLLDVAWRHGIGVLHACATLANCVGWRERTRASGRFAVRWRAARRAASMRPAVARPKSLLIEAIGCAAGGAAGAWLQPRLHGLGLPHHGKQIASSSRSRSTGRISPLPRPRACCLHWSSEWLLLVPRRYGGAAMGARRGDIAGVRSGDPPTTRERFGMRRALVGREGGNVAGHRSRAP